MTANRARIEELFDAAHAMTGATRQAYLDRECGDDAELRRQVQTLLRAHEEAGSFLETVAGVSAGAAARATMAPMREAPGATIGRYKLLQLIGEGGFGSVFMAEQQEPVRRKVALKIIKLGMDTKEVVARFEAERQALALMDHPNIARVLDAGATDTGRPYFVMELVRGVPITNYCDTNNLPVDERLELFIKVCQAVQHAHQKGIIHRDLKPSNVMVTMAEGKPSPKVIDFGIAKATDQRLTEKTIFTEFRQLIGTPQYMSPEQAEMAGIDIDTRSDIYSLGVLLYELLVGSTPFDPRELRSKAFAEMQRIIREVEPPRPSVRLTTMAENLPTIAAHRRIEPRKLGNMLQGELDWIVMRAMEKDRTRRYETANGLAADLGRYMADQPVLARPPSKWYSFRKSVRRNKGLFASVAAVAAAMVLGLGGMTTGFLRAQRERDHAIAAHQSELVERDHAQQSERERRLQLVDSLKSAAPHGVPMIVESLQASPEQVLPVLRRRFDDKTAPDTERLRTACALSALGEPPIEFLIDAMPTAPAAESANLIRALGAGGRAVVVALASKSSAESDAPTRVRYASTLLSLGDPAPAAGSLAAGPDPGMRTAFIAGFASWHGDLQPALGLLKSTRDPDVRSGLCAAIGSVDPASLSATERQEAQTLLSQLFRDAPDGGTHGAAGWALRHWRIAEPEIAPSNEPPRGRDWFANPHGMTFVRMNPGTFRMGASPGKIVLLTNGFFICDRETSIADFNKFIDDASVPDSDKPRDWPGPDKSVGVTPECPVQNVNYFDMILYCNWLSQREGRKPCYSTEDGASGNWKCDLTASGYRLPTGAEWEYACRGGAQTQFPFGDDGRYIQAYANIAETTYDPCGSRLPNAWGLFDMLGSAWELCWEHNDGPPAAMNVNPIRSPMDGRGTMYGGAFHGGTFYAHPSSHANINLDTRAASNGFRLVCADSASPSTQPTLPTIERLLDKAATQPATRPLTP